MRLRYQGSCRLCGRHLRPGTLAVHERDTRTVRCADHGSTGVLTARAAGTAGASAREEHRRRRANHEAALRATHPRLGGLILALTGDPSTTKAWAIGAAGEEKLGRRLDSIVSPEVRVLHDRRIPGSRANIDHLVVGPGGVFVIDAKKYQGRPRLETHGGFIKPRVETLRVDARDCSGLVDGMHRQIETVRQLLAERSDSTLVHGMLCFVDADWPLIGGSFTVRGVEVLWPRKAVTRVLRPGPFDRHQVEAICRRLALALRPAH